MIKRLTKAPPTGSLVFIIAVFELIAFGLLSMSTEPVDFMALGFGVLSVAMLLFQYGVLRAFFPDIDMPVLIIANVLVAVGLILQYRLDVDVAVKQMQWYAISMACMCVAIVLVRRVKIWPRLFMTYGYMAVGIFLLVLAAFFGSEAGGASNWFAFAVMSFQPSEFVKVLLIFILASVLAKKRGFLRLAPLGIFLVLSVALLVVQNDLGAALLYFATALVMIYLGTNNLPLIGAALGAGTAGAIASYKMFNHVRVRVEIWKNPWATPTGSGYQIVQSLIAIASGGLFGLGLGCGTPKSIPAYHTDFIFAVVCEEFGQIFGVVLILFYFVLVWRGMIIALRAQTRFDALLAYGCVTMICLQTVLIIGGVIKMIPLTGVTLPFVSYGGTSLVTNMVLVGILQGVSLKNAVARRGESL
jgi:cell division protein FtsW (lipid II flippase)